MVQNSGSQDLHTHVILSYNQGRVLPWLWAGSLTSFWNHFIKTNDSVLFFQPNFKQLIHQTTRRWNRLNQRICLFFILLPYFIKIKNSIKPQSWGKISPNTGQKSDILPSLKLAIERYTTKVPVFYSLMKKFKSLNFYQKIFVLIFNKSRWVLSKLVKMSEKSFW